MRYVNQRTDGVTTEGPRAAAAAVACHDQGAYAAALRLIRQERPALARSIELCWGSPELQRRLTDTVMGRVVGEPAMGPALAQAVLMVANRHADLA